MADKKLVSQARLLAILGMICDDDRLVAAVDKVAPEGFLDSVLVKSEQICQEIIDSGKSEESFEQFVSVFIYMLEQDMKTLEEV